MKNVTLLLGTAEYDYLRFVSIFVDLISIRERVMYDKIQMLNQ